MDKKVDKESILEEVRSLSPDRLAEVEDFVDFLVHRQAAGQLATAAFTRVWDNSADADYDRL